MCNILIGLCDVEETVSGWLFVRLLDGRRLAGTRQEADSLPFQFPTAATSVLRVSRRARNGELTG
jgi:hypothetical protein